MKVSTLAGETPLFVDGPVSLAQLFNPSDVVVIENESIMVADSGNHAIRQIYANGTVSTLAGSNKATAPEVIQIKQVFGGSSRKTDIYSLGVLLHYLMSN